MLAQPSVTDPQGDVLAIQGTNVASVTYTPGLYTIDCTGNGPIYSGGLFSFCAEIQVTDSISGTQAPVTNTQTEYIYDACGTLVHTGSTYGWHVSGTNYFSSGLVGSDIFTVPPSNFCWGPWMATYTFSETFTDGQTLTDTNTVTFLAYLSGPASPTAFNGDGHATDHNPSACAGDPVNCGSGNFSEAFTDVAVPGRGPGLELTRTYNSLSASTPGIFGYGWSSSYEAHLAVNGDGSVTVTEDDGSQVTAQAAAGGTYTVPTWASSTLTHNGDGTWTFVRQQSTTYTFSAAGRLTALTDRNGYSTQLSYDASGRLATVTDPAGRAITFTFGTNGFVSQVADPIGQVTHYSYDGSGNLTSVEDPLLRTTSFTYDTNHLLQTLTDPNLGVTTNVYDTSGRVTRQTDPAGLPTRFDYSGDNFSDAGGTTTITDPHGNATVESYTSGLMSSMTKGSGTAAAGTWTYSHDPGAFGVTSVKDPAGNVTKSTYDSSGNLLTRFGPIHATIYTYNSFNELLTVRDSLGIVTAHTYDANGNALTKTVTGIGGSPTATTTYSYTDGHAGDVTNLTDPAGHATDYSYDAQGDVVSQTTHPSTGVNHTTAFVYDTLGRKTCEASPTATASGVQCPAAGQPRIARTTTWVYDTDSEMTSVTDPLGNLTSYSYDGDGNQAQTTDPVGNLTKTTYDADSRKSTVTTGYGTPAASTTSYGYDIAPAVGVCANPVSGTTFCTSSTDPGGQTTVDYLNSRGERIQQIQPSSGTSTSTYDATGNLATLTTSGGTATYRYDAENELTSITYSNPAPGFAAAANVGYVYDRDGHRTSMSDGSGTTTYSYDPFERLASVTDGAGSVVSYGYDLDNEVTAITYPGRNQTVTQTYDGAGQESSVRDWLSHTTNFSYDADGNLTTGSYPNSTTVTSTYDATGDLLSTKDAPTANLSNPFASFTYTYNADSQVQTETDTGTPAPISQNYSYDQVSRLTSSTSGSYAYDTSGDLTQLGAGAQTFNAAHQLTAQAQTISRVGVPASAGDNGTGSVLNLTLPAGTAANDQILLAVTLPGSQSVKTTPSGYTAVGTYSSGTGASNVKLALYRRTAQTGDTTVAVTFSGTFAKAATLIVYRGVNPVTPIDVSSSGTTATGTSVTAPSLTTTKANDELVVAEGAESSSAGSWTAPSGMTTRVSQAGGPTTTGSLADQALGTAGSTGSRTATFSVTGSLAAALVALRPAQNTYSYDSLGDRSTITTPAGSSTLTYNQLGEMTAYGATTDTYNGDGLRMAKTSGHTTESFTWEPAGSSGIPAILVDGSIDYVYGPDGLPLEQINGNTVLYYLHDQLGSTRALVGSTGSAIATYTYSSYGGLAGSTGTTNNPIGFAGSFTDSESSLLYLQHRYYDPSTGQFTSVDPLVIVTGAAYAYAAGDPLDGTDPLGLCKGVFGCIGSGLNKVVHVVETHTIGFCVTATAGVGGFGQASGCIVLAGGKPAVTTTLGGGGSSPTASLTGGLLISNAHSPRELSRWFGLAGASADLGPSVGDQFSTGKGDCGRPIWENEFSGGLGLDLPVPFETHGGASYTWVWSL